MVIIAVPGGFTRAPVPVRTRPGIAIVWSIQRALGRLMTAPGAAPGRWTRPIHPVTLAADLWLLSAGPGEAPDEGRSTDVSESETNQPPEVNEPDRPGRMPPTPSPRGRRRRPTLDVDPLEKQDTPKALRNAIDRLLWDLVDRKDKDRR